jgi:hypothetical protein
MAEFPGQGHSLLRQDRRDQAWSCSHAAPVRMPILQGGTDSMGYMDGTVTYHS